MNRFAKIASIILCIIILMMFPLSAVATSDASELHSSETHICGECNESLVKCPYCEKLYHEKEPYCPDIQLDFEKEKNGFIITLIGTIIATALLLYCQVMMGFDWMISVVFIFAVGAMCLLTYSNWTNMNEIETLISLSKEIAV